VSDVPVFPKAWQIYAYLEDYVKRYIPDSVFQFNTTVVSTEKWIITKKPTTNTSDKDQAQDQQETEYIFDFVVIAPRQLSSPGKPPFAIDPNSNIPILHSIAYRSLADIFPARNPFHAPSPPNTILVVGGSYSGVDIASLIALQLSPVQWSPSSSSPSPQSQRSAIDKDVNILHVISHPLFAIPGIVRNL
jgi:cation diffusion facilitator CzcD-associated flavoprotein CzcO